MICLAPGCSALTRTIRMLTASYITLRTGRGRRPVGLIASTFIKVGLHRSAGLQFFLRRVLLTSRSEALAPSLAAYIGPLQRSNRVLPHPGRPAGPRCLQTLRCDGQSEGRKDGISPTLGRGYRCVFTVHPMGTQTIATTSVSLYCCSVIGINFLHEPNGPQLTLNNFVRSIWSGSGRGSSALPPV